MSRRQFVKILGTFGVAGCAGNALFIEPHNVSVSRQTLRAPGVTGPGRVVTFVHLSDLHIRQLGRFEKLVAHTATMLGPDFIVITGDALNHENDLDTFGRFLDLFQPGVPVYGVPGNWEVKGGVGPDRLDPLYRKHGGRYLVNETLRLRHQDAEFLLSGVDDYLFGKPDLQSALKGVLPAGNHLLLVHCPAYRDVVAGLAGRLNGCDPDFVLAGHTHGGQITFFGAAPYVPPGSGSYKSGWYGGQGPGMYVSRGIGTTFIPARFMAPPEIVFYEWHLGQNRPSARTGTV